MYMYIYIYLVVYLYIYVHIYIYIYVYIISRNIFYGRVIYNKFRLGRFPEISLPASSGPHDVLSMV